MNYPNDEIHELEKVLPLSIDPLIQCITNEITSELIANALLFIHAKPIMADDVRELKEIIPQVDALLLNLGHLSKAREKSIRKASKIAQTTKTPCVVDLVGVAATKRRKRLALVLEKTIPSVIKGNISEMRCFVGLPSNSRGVDGAKEDQTKASLHELIPLLEQRTKKTNITYLATGEVDVLVTNKKTILLKNGVPKLNQFTGTGDIVGGLIAAFLGGGHSASKSCISAISYLNYCGELADKSNGLAQFRHQTMNHLSLELKNDAWIKNIKGEEYQCNQT
ncbi:MAG: hydroxyethylthiazole kinase [Enterococcus sp.]